MESAKSLAAAEDARMAAVRRYDVLDTPPDGAFDRIAAAAAELFDVPIGIVTIVDTDRIWFKAHHGLDGVSEVGREPGLCASAILGDQPWVVTDAATDPRTLANPLVAGSLGLRFYVGAPLTTHDGFNLGTLCVLDTEPREVQEAETKILQNLASIVVDQLELRLSARRSAAVAAERLEQTEMLASALQRSLLPPAIPDVPHVRVAAAYHPADRFQVGGDFYDIFPIDSSTWALTIGDVCGKGPDAAGRTSNARYSMRAAAIQQASPAAVLGLVNQALQLDASLAAEGSFVTALFARLTPRPDGTTVEFASGGHPLPTVVRSDGTVEQVGTPGTLLGVLTEGRATDATVDLAIGDTMVLVTDGVLDSGQPRLEQDGLESLLGSCAGAEPGEVAQRIHAAVGQAQSDDVAIIVVTAGR